MAVAQQTTGNRPSHKAKIPFRLRFKAWWEGYDLLVRHQDVAGDGTAGEAAAVAPPEPEKAYVDLIQDVWGEGFSTPGDTDYLLELVKPLGLNPAMSMLEIGAGLGGMARLMAEHFGVWVTGVESNREFAEAGMELSTKAGLAKKSPIEVFDPENFEAKSSAYDYVFSKEQLFTVTDKMRLLKMIESSLKNRGQILFTDYVLAKKNGVTAGIKAWMEAESLKDPPWSVSDYETALVANRFDVRITDDITDRLRTQVTRTWSELMVAAHGGNGQVQLSSGLLAQAELWTRRVKAMESGDLRVYRFHALKKASEDLLSDW